MTSRTTTPRRDEDRDFEVVDRIKPRLTPHAQERLTQRGIRDLQLQLIQAFGIDHLQKGGSVLSRIPERRLAELRAALDRCADLAIIKGRNECVITVMHQHRRIRHTEWAA